MRTMDVVALLLGVLGVAALASVILFGFFGKPSTDEGKKRKQHVVNGVVATGGILLGTVLMGCLIASVGAAFGTMRGTSLSPLGKLGNLAIALVSLALIIAMMHRWAKYFAGWTGYAVWGALMTASSGHLENNPAIHVPRAYSLEMAGLLTIQTLTAVRFTEGD